MIKHTLNFVAAVTLATSVMAGGDDRNKGPVEALEVTTMPSNEVDRPIDSQVSETTKSVTREKVTSISQASCQKSLGLSDNNIAIFKNAKNGNYLGNTGPMNSFGTVFSPNRWNSYMSCVNTNNS